MQGPRTIDTATPLDRIPLFIRAGSILPMGPEIQWSTEKPADPIEIRIYRGADGEFTLLVAGSAAGFLATSGFWPTLRCDRSLRPRSS